jgi:hypothetical protein
MLSKQTITFISSICLGLGFVGTGLELRSWLPNPSAGTQVTQYVPPVFPGGSRTGGGTRFMEQPVPVDYV